MDFNASKCHVLEFGRSKYWLSGDYKLGDRCLEKVRKEKDLGLIIPDDVSLEGHVNKVFGESVAILANNHANFNHLDRYIIKRIIVSILRPKLDYGHIMMSPHLVKHKKKLERVQRTATKMIPGLEHLDYHERLRVLELNTLEERRARGNMIQIYKCVRV